MAQGRRVHGASSSEDERGDPHECHDESQAIALGTATILLHNADVVFGVDQSLSDDAQRQEEVRERTCGIGGV